MAFASFAPSRDSGTFETTGFNSSSVRPSVRLSAPSVVKEVKGLRCIFTVLKLVAIYYIYYSVKIVSKVFPLDWFQLLFQDMACVKRVVSKYGARKDFGCVKMFLVYGIKQIRSIQSLCNHDVVKNHGRKNVSGVVNCRKHCFNHFA